MVLGPAMVLYHLNYLDDKTKHQVKCADYTTFYVDTVVELTFVVRTTLYPERNLSNAEP